MRALAPSAPALRLRHQDEPIASGENHMNLEILAIQNFPMVEPGDNLADLIEQSLGQNGLSLKDGDILCLAQKIVSKAENCYVDLNTIIPSEEAIALGKEVDKDARKVQLILDESVDVVRSRPGVLIVEHKLGFVHANAGIDQSNIALDGVSQEELCLLLPKDPDASAHALKVALEDRYQCRLGVIINDSVGRAWRMGTVGLAIGVAGVTALEDYIGESDIYGAELKVTQVAAADELAAGASVVMGQTTERVPLVLIRGYEGRQNAEAEAMGVKPLIRPKQMDMFR